MYWFSGRYQYEPWFKSNWRAAVALVCGFLPPLPGLINYITPEISVSTGAQHLFSLGYVFSFLSSSVIYYGLMRLFPATESMMDYADLGEDQIIAGDHGELEGDLSSGSRAQGNYLEKGAVA
jgi:NCS1 family nucleobase:cation symporter-1